ncbi:unnamed protein product [Owenia fusiformis]|uniref:Uncharacterized protein n=1 Tax=Owenia fusiformis TaxID=6347 RepID=A0A8J1XS16_OWEFU|nr:unnamed protein product [Owenia fusiformis]
MADQGGSCSEDQHCLGGFCIVEEQKCAQCRVDSDCDPTDYCNRLKGNACINKVANGGLCNDDNECLDNICIDSRCASCFGNSECPSEQYCEGNQCTYKKERGAACSSDSECVSSICDGLCGSCKYDEQCPSTQYCNGIEDQSVANECIVKLEVGVVCSRKQACADGHCNGVCGQCTDSFNCRYDEYCHGQNSPDVPRVCKRLLENGKKCTDDEQCMENVCISTTGVCGGCEEDKDCGLWSFCENVQDKFKDCKNKLANGNKCERDTQCRTGHCDFVCGQCNADNDCLPEEYCSGMGDPDTANTCEYRVHLGESCSRVQECMAPLCVDNICTECTSNSDCDDISYCEFRTLAPKYATCVPKKRFNNACKQDSMCLSGMCLRGVCKDCVVGSDCPQFISAQFCSRDNRCVTKIQTGSSVICFSHSECASDNCCRNRCSRTWC